MTIAVDLDLGRIATKQTKGRERVGIKNETKIRGKNVVILNVKH